MGAAVGNNPPGRCLVPRKYEFPAISGGGADPRRLGASGPLGVSRIRLAKKALRYARPVVTVASELRKNVAILSRPFEGQRDLTSEIVHRVVRIELHHVRDLGRDLLADGVDAGGHAAKVGAERKTP